MGNLINFQDSFFIAGAYGMVGRAIYKNLLKNGYGNEKIGGRILRPSRNELDLTNFDLVNKWFQINKPTIVIICAAKVGGIIANSEFPFEFLIENLKIQNNLIEISKMHKVKRLLFLGSSCIYPKFAKQPIKEEYLLNGKLEKTNEPYAVAKIAGIKLCESYNRQYNLDFRSVMPTNLYGQFDNFHLTNGHVIPSLMHRFHLAKIKELPKVEVWGSGKPLREFLHVDDLSDACMFMLQLPKSEYQKNTEKLASHINIGSGNELSISELVSMIKTEVGYKGDVVFNKDYPDGTPRKMIDSSKLMRLGWKPKINLKIGLHLTYEWFKENFYSMRK